MYLQSLSQAGHLCNSRANSSGGSVLPQSPSGPLNSKVRSSRFNQILQARVTDLARQSWSRSCLNLNRMKQLHRIHISAPKFWTNYSWTKWPQPLGAGRERKAGGVKTWASINTVLQAGMLSKQTLRQEKIIIKKLITWDELFPSAQAKPSLTRGWDLNRAKPTLQQDMQLGGQSKRWRALGSQLLLEKDSEGARRG